MSAAYAFVQAMLKAGRNPTRADLVSAVNGGLPQGPAVAPYALQLLRPRRHHRGVHRGDQQRGHRAEGLGDDHGHLALGCGHHAQRRRAGGPGQRHPVALTGGRNILASVPARRAAAGGGGGAVRRAELPADHRGRDRRRAGIATGSFYAHFRSKAEILRRGGPRDQR